MQQRSLAASTVLGHLAKALELGYFVDYRKGHHHTTHSYIVHNLRSLAVFTVQLV